ncbi:MULTISPECIES: type B 50S ribosomal protein L31 [Borreliella]|uniref:Large ribosomal subunit protein bL31B n=3 Tax=Borreliella TaxID=64895 RepID=RL31B_BORGP|nr:MULTISPECIES: type B 50S ribosomal protein L31 [Borreliella]Q662D5.1 RecName: Full=Large ribosomal subunit protein bL31B; AltName: Full=50S ribosomal protein L31 type B [Borreliella bavariensis PBi]AAU07086.1 ribosomal protein L31 [Borreliella bavariensis PBi]AEW68569.1 RpmE2 [Borreliella garinii BgVir]AFT83561.1 50S ribosomal protein L31 type B [Borreliella garinii NMJW1]AHZ74312.1 50S ribosomal protein L31 type B [Borreliella garinii SZ]APQ15328.1 50S ribosomal protein L31 [Borreliella g
MRKGVHPKNNLVVFKDGSNGAMFLTRSTLNSKETIKYTDGKEYPLITVEITSRSHPFYTGQQKFVDAAGRIDKFNKRYKKS